jgi:hypothetical protein
MLAKMVIIAVDFTERVIHGRTQDVEKHHTNAYLHALSALVRLAFSIPRIESLNFLYRSICITQKTPFNRQARENLQIVANQQSRIEFDTLILLFRHVNHRMSKSIANGLPLLTKPLFL